MIIHMTSNCTNLLTIISKARPRRRWSESAAACTTRISTRAASEAASHPTSRPGASRWHVAAPPAPARHVSPSPPSYPKPRRRAKRYPTTPRCPSFHPRTHPRSARGTRRHPHRAPRPSLRPTTRALARSPGPSCAAPPRPTTEPWRCSGRKPWRRAPRRRRPPWPPPSRVAPARVCRSRHPRRGARWSARRAPPPPGSRRRRPTTSPRRLTSRRTLKEPR
mmetsp:Transcript_10697/g.49122  ORF Transcript_10697/g.49122 Transcript_10697/m.49122 type:complete len:221 (-) Transcript_10697:398-1060(-)